MTTGADSGAGSLRAAVEASRPGDTISSSPSVTEASLDGPIYLNGGVTIDGAGAFSNGAVEIYGSVVAPNTSTATGPSFPSARAGGLASRGNMTVIDTSVEDNEAIATGPDANTTAWGIYGYRVTTITNSSVLRNSSRSIGEQADAHSGGLYIANPDSTIFNHSPSTTRHKGPSVGRHLDLSSIPLAALPRELAAATRPTGSDIEEYISRMHLRIFGSLALLVGLMVVPGSPAGAALLCTAYVTNGDGDNVSVIDTATTTVTTSIDVGDGPRAVVVTPDGTTAYVANGSGASVSVIDTATNTVTATIDTGEQPLGMAITPDGATLYVGLFAIRPNDTVAVIDTATNTIAATIEVERNPVSAAITPDGTTLYVVNGLSDSVSVIDTATNTVTTTIDIGPFRPRAVAITPDGATAYVTNRGFDDGVVTVIDTATNTVTTSFLVGDTPQGVAITPNGTTAYVANNISDSVSVIDTATNTVTTTIDSGFNGPWGVAFTPDSATAYVTNDDDASVSVVDTATNTVTDTITVGPFPNAVAIGRCTTPEPGIDAEVTGDGRTVSVSGSGFPADAAVTVALEGVTLGSATADGSGTFTGAFTVADCALTGGTLTATAGDSVAATEVTLVPCGSPGPTPGPNPAPVVPRFTG